MIVANKQEGYEEVNIFLFRYAFNHIGSRYLPPSFDNKTLSLLSCASVGNIDFCAQHNIFNDILDLGLELIFMNIFKDAM